jgi:RNA polymerase-binding transcription factor DksA
MDEGLYGICEVGSETIPLERLKANPAARTCVEHSDD